MTNDKAHEQCAEIGNGFDSNSRASFACCRAFNAVVHPVVHQSTESYLVHDHRRPQFVRFGTINRKTTANVLGLLPISSVNLCATNVQKRAAYRWRSKVIDCWKLLRTDLSAADSIIDGIFRSACSHLLRSISLFPLEPVAVGSLGCLKLIIFKNILFRIVRAMASFWTLEI